MPRPNKRKKQLTAVQDGTGKRRKTSKPREERLKEPKEDSSPIEAFVVPDTISSLHGKKRTPIAEADTNTALPGIVTSLPPAITPADVDVVDDANVNGNTDSVTDTQSNTLI
jgi:hypothetical protein